MNTLTHHHIVHIKSFLISHYRMERDEKVCNEVLDHIACDIEEKMNQGVVYSEAFKLIFSQWHKDLQPSSFNGFQKIPRFIAKRLIQKDLRFQVALIVGLMVFLLVVKEWSILVIINIFFLLIASWGLSRWYLHQIKNQRSYAVVYYKTQIKYLGYLNGCTIAFLLLFLGWFWDALNLTYGTTAIGFSSSLLFAYNAYFSYRLNQLNVKTKPI